MVRGRSKTTVAMKCFFFLGGVLAVLLLYYFFGGTRVEKNLISRLICADHELYIVNTID